MKCAKCGEEIPESQQGSRTICAKCIELATNDNAIKRIIQQHSEEEVLLVTPYILFNMVRDELKDSEPELLRLLQIAIIIKEVPRKMHELLSKGEEERFFRLHAIIRDLTSIYNEEGSAYKVVNYFCEGLDFIPLKTPAEMQDTAQENEPEVTLNTDTPKVDFYYSKEEGYENVRENYETIEYYTSEIQKNPANIENYYFRGYLYNKCNEHEKSIADFTKAIFLDPENPNYYSERGLVYYVMQDYDKALEDFSSAIALSPNNSYYYFFRGSANGEKEDYTLAIDDLTKAMQLNGKIDGFYSQRGFIFYKIRAYDLAITDYTRAIQLEPVSIEYFYIRGLLYREIKDYQRAIDDIANAIRLDPYKSELYNDLGLLYFLIGDYQKATENYSKAIKLNPKIGYYYTNRRHAYKKLKKHIRAMRDLFIFIRLSISDAKTQDELKKGMKIYKKGEI